MKVISNLLLLGKFSDCQKGIANQEKLFIVRSVFYVTSSIHYTGRSTTKLQTRIVGHRSHVGYSDDLISETDERTLAEHLKEAHHFNSVDCFNSNYIFSILDVSSYEISS